MNSFVAIILKHVFDFAGVSVTKYVKSVYLKEFIIKLSKAFFKNVQVTWLPFFYWIDLVLSVGSTAVVFFFNHLTIIQKYYHFILALPLAFLLLTLMIPTLVKYREFIENNPDFDK